MIEKTAAIIVNGEVVNHIVWDGITPWKCNIPGAVVELLDEEQSLECEPGKVVEEINGKKRFKAKGPKSEVTPQTQS